MYGEAKVEVEARQPVEIGASNWFVRTKLIARQMACSPSPLLRLFTSPRQLDMGKLFGNSPEEKQLGAEAGQGGTATT